MAQILFSISQLSSALFPASKGSLLSSKKAPINPVKDCTLYYQKADKISNQPVNII